MYRYIYKRKKEFDLLKSSTIDINSYFTPLDIHKDIIYSSIYKIKFEPIMPELDSNSFL